MLRRRTRRQSARTSGARRAHVAPDSTTVAHGAVMTNEISAAGFGQFDLGYQYHIKGKRVVDFLKKLTILKNRSKLYMFVDFSWLNATR